jgi:hypothetical protein
MRSGDIWFGDIWLGGATFGRATFGRATFLGATFGWATFGWATFGWATFNWATFGQATFYCSTGLACSPMSRLSVTSLEIAWELLLTSRYVTGSLTSIDISGFLLLRIARPILIVALVCNWVCMN